MLSFTLHCSLKFGFGLILQVDFEAVQLMFRLEVTNAVPGEHGSPHGLPKVPVGYIRKTK